MTALFISYRRKDSAASAGRLYDRLAPTFEHVFKDVDNIRPGEDYRVKLNEAIDRSDVVLVIIGPDWLTITGADGRRRLDHPEDFVRYEIEQSLATGKFVIPVLVDGAVMADDQDLPPSIRQLSFLHAAVVEQDPDFHRDVDRLIAVIKEQMGPGDAPGQATAAPRDRRSRRWLLVAAALLVLILVAFWAVGDALPVNPQATPTVPISGGTPPRVTATPITCEGFMVSRLTIGAQGRVTTGQNIPNRLREQPATDAVQIGRIPSGAVFQVLDGPVCADGFAWWQVAYDGRTGWTAEGTDGDYWLEPVE